MIESSDSPPHEFENEHGARESCSCPVGRWHDVEGNVLPTGSRVQEHEQLCAVCGEGIRLDTAGPDSGVLAGASVWVHERFYPFGTEPHDPFPGSSDSDPCAHGSHYDTHDGMRHCLTCDHVETKPSGR